MNSVRAFFSASATFVGAFPAPPPPILCGRPTLVGQGLARCSFFCYLLINPSAAACKQAGGNDGGAGRLRRAWSCEKRCALWQPKVCCDAFMDVSAERHLHVHRDSAGGALGSERAFGRLSEPGAHGHHRQCPVAASAGLRVCATFPCPRPRALLAPLADRSARKPSAGNTRAGHARQPRAPRAPTPRPRRRSVRVSVYFILTVGAALQAQATERGGAGHV